MSNTLNIEYPLHQGNVQVSLDSRLLNTKFMESAQTTAGDIPKSIGRRDGGKKFIHYFFFLFAFFVCENVTYEHSSLSY